MGLFTARHNLLLIVPALRMKFNLEHGAGITFDAAVLDQMNGKLRSHLVVGLLFDQFVSDFSDVVKPLTNEGVPGRDTWCGRWIWR